MRRTVTHVTHEQLLRNLARDLKAAVCAQDWNAASNLTRRLADGLVCSGKADNTPLEWLYGPDTDGSKAA